MSAASKLIDTAVLSSLIPLKSLEHDKLRELAEKSLVRQFASGETLFSQGERSKHLLYLLNGTVELARQGGEKEKIKAGSARALRPLCEQGSAGAACVARSPVSVACVDADLLDLLLNWGGAGGLVVSEIETDAQPDWMSGLLHNKALLKLPPENIQALMSCVEPVEIRPGDVIVRQGDDDGRYYIISRGRCKVTRQPAAGAKEIQLATLGPGEAFGEESLISRSPRNATITAIEAGLLLRLDHDDFCKLIERQFLKYVSYAEALALKEQGAVILDIRTEDEYRENGLGVNLPLALVRLKAQGMDKGRQYVALCNDGKLSAVAAFLMSQKGLDVHVLRGGLSALAKARPAAAAKGAGRPAQTAEIVSLAAVKQTAGEHDGQGADARAQEQERKYGQLKARFDEIQSCLDEAMKRAEGAEQARAHLEHEVARLGRELEQTRRCADELTRGHAQAATKSMADFSARIAELESRLGAALERAAAAEQAHAAASAEAANLARALEQGREDLARARDESSALQAHLRAESAARIGELEPALEAARQRAETAERLRQEAEGAMARLQQELADSRLALEQAKDEAARLRDQDGAQWQQRIAQLQQALETQLQQAVEAQRRCQDLERETGELGARLEEARRELALEAGRGAQLRDEYRSERERLEAEHAQRQSELAQRLEQAVREREALMADYSARVQEHALLSGEREQLAQRIMMLEQAGCEREARADELRQALAQRESQVEDYARMQRELARLQGELAVQETRFAQARREGEALRAEVEAGLQQRLSRMEASLGSALCRAQEAESACEQRSQEIGRLQSELSRAAADAGAALERARAEARRQEAEFQTSVENISRLLLEQTRRADDAEQVRREQQSQLERYGAELEQARRALAQSAPHAPAAGEMQSALDEARQRLGVMENRHAELELEAARLHSELEDARQRAASAEEELNAQVRRAEKAHAEAEFSKMLIKVKEARSERMRQHLEHEAGEGEETAQADFLPQRQPDSVQPAPREAGAPASAFQRSFAVQEPDTSRASQWLTGAIGLVVALALVYAAYVYFGGKDDPAAVTGQTSAPAQGIAQEVPVTGEHANRRPAPSRGQAASVKRQTATPTPVAAPSADRGTAVKEAAQPKGNKPDVPAASNASAPPAQPRRQESAAPVAQAEPPQEISAPVTAATALPERSVPVEPAVEEKAVPAAAISAPVEAPEAAVAAPVAVEEHAASAQAAEAKPEAQPAAATAPAATATDQVVAE